jgi:membrane protease YdiL (CAAX protease family)
MIQGATPGPRSLEPVASYRHTLGLLAILGAVFAISFALQHGPAAVATAAAQAAPALPPVQRGIIPGLIESLVFDWGMLWYVWGGLRDWGGSLLQLSGREWRGAGDVVKDLALAAPFWVLWEATALAVWAIFGRFFGLPNGPHDETFPVRGISEIALWIAVSLSAGFCEELIFRGYLQRQFSALTGRLWSGVLLQGIVFGLIHPRGWKAVVVISILGVLYGGLAAWRNNLRPGIVAHGWSDLWEGWLKFGVPPKL